MNSNRAGPWKSALLALGGDLFPVPLSTWSGRESAAGGWRALADAPVEVASRLDGPGTVVHELRLARERHPSSLSSVEATAHYFGPFATVNAANPAPYSALCPRTSSTSAAAAVVASALIIATRAESDVAADLVSAATRTAVDVEHALGLVAELGDAFASIDVTYAVAAAADTTARAAVAARSVRAAAAAVAAEEVARTAAATAVAVRLQADAFAAKVAAAAESRRITASARSADAGAAEAASALAAAVATAAAVHAESTALAATLVAGAVAAAAARVAYTDSVADDALELEVSAAAARVRAVAVTTAQHLAIRTSSRAADAAFATRAATDIVATGRMAAGQPTVVGRGPRVGVLTGGPSHHG